MIKIERDRVGKNAYKVSKVWKLGPHIFFNDGDIIFRFCYLRTKLHTFYIQLSINICKKGEQNGK